ncbi:MAG: hypothetical protein ACKOOL_03465 [Novosphingobium sp.]
MTADRWLIFASFAPYLSVAAYDGWLHEKARRVPFAEQCFHAAAALSLPVLLWALLTGRTSFAIAALAVFALAALIDELRFHGPLPHHERRLHFLGYVCFAGFAVITWQRGGFG